MLKFSRARALPIIPPSESLVPLRILVDWLGVHFVDIPEGEAKDIEAYGQRWKEEKLPPSLKAMDVPIDLPESVLGQLYRRHQAAAFLYTKLAVIKDDQSLWRSWSVANEPLKLRAKDHDRALAILVKIVEQSESYYTAILDGKQEANVNICIDWPTNLEPVDKQWLASLGFKTDEILDLLADDLGIVREDESSQSPASVERKTPPEGIDSFPLSREISTAFEDVLEKDKKQWGDLLKSPPEWLKPARVIEGSNGRDAFWDPIGIARALFGGVRVQLSPDKISKGRRYHTLKTSLARLDVVFRRHLPAWDQEWQKCRDDLESYSAKDSQG